MLTFLRSSLLVLVMISSMSMHICNYFHARQAKITKFLEGYPSLIPACATLFELRGFRLGLLKFTFNAENFIRWLFFVYLQPFWRNSLLKCVLQPEIAKNSLKPAILGVQGHSKALMLTFLRSATPVLVVISSMSVPICNHFHVRRAYSGKITLFKRVPLFRPLVRRDPLYSAGWNFVTKY